MLNRPNNPRCPPDWRYRRALELAERRHAKFAGCDDDAIQGLTLFLRAWRRAQNAEEHQRAARRWPTVYQAHQLHTSESRTGLRAVVESRLLAGESHEAIARESGLTATEVGAYKLLFFDIRNRPGDIDSSAPEVIHAQLG
jgi:hypothetical protein